MAEDNTNWLTLTNSQFPPLDNRIWKTALGTDADAQSKLDYPAELTTNGESHLSETLVSLAQSLTYWPR